VHCRLPRRADELFGIVAFAVTATAAGARRDAARRGLSLRCAVARQLRRLRAPMHRGEMKHHRESRGYSFVNSAYRRTRRSRVDRHFAQQLLGPVNRQKSRQAQVVEHPSQIGAHLAGETRRLADQIEDVLVRQPLIQTRRAQPS